MPALPYDICAVIPAFNEAPTIEKAVMSTRHVLGEHASIIVVDDGSTDATADCARRAGAYVIAHATNLGKGAAIKTGVLSATQPWVLMLDADLSTLPEELYYFVPFLETADILIGSRRAPGARITLAQPWYRVWAGELFNVAFRHISGLPYRDTQCGFKLFRTDACRSIFEQLMTQTWSTDAEILMRAQAAGLRIIELPVQWRHNEGSRVRFSHAPRILLELRRLKKMIS